MANRWKTVRIRDICSSITSGGTPDTRVQAYWNGNIPWLSSGETGGRYIFDTVKKITQLGVENSSTRLAHIGDIAIASAGQGFTRGQAAYLLIDTYVNQSVVILEADKKVVDSRFLFFNIDSRYNQLRDISDSHSSRGSLTTKLLAELEIELPPLPEQRAIAEVLGALDDKIELNRRMNRTLEGIARAVFRHWFVESEEIKEWKTVSLPEIIDVNPPRLLKNSDIAPYLDMANMPTQGHRGVEWVDRPFSSGTKFINGDTLLARITPCLENGKTAFVDFLKDGQVGWGSTEYIVFHPKPPLPPEYGYLLARSEELRNHAIVNMTGTSGRQRTPASCFDNFLVYAPPDRLAIKFGEFIRPLFDKIKANDEESRTLASMRNALLPKLMRGEVRVTIHE